MKIITTTDRIILREFALEDAEGFFDMNNDPIVLKYTGNEPFKDIEETRMFIKNYDQYQKRGFGRWTMIHKESGDYMGFCGLRYSEEKKETDIGFRLLQKYWSKGYATEAAIATLKVGFENFDLDKIVGRAMKNNQASHRVLEKLGMKKAFDFEEDQQFWTQYELLREDF